MWKEAMAMRDSSIRQRSPRGGMGGRVMSLVLLAWLVAGLVAAGQRGYFNVAAVECPQLATLGVTVLAGPLNYLGLNPKIGSCQLPEPSQ